ncbi:hypothetical protein TB2_038323 [Malus domestica]
MQSVVIHEINEETTTLQQVADGGKVNDQGEGGSLTFPDSSPSVRNRQKKEKEPPVMEISQSPQKKGRGSDSAFSIKDAGLLAWDGGGWPSTTAKSP